MTTATKRLVLRKNQDRRVRGGHPWIFSNEVATLEGAPAPGDLVEVADVRGAFLGRAYYNPQSLICARLVTRKRDEVDADLFVKRMERAVRLREAALPGERALRVVYGESDFLPGLVVDRYGDHLAVQVLTLGMEVRQDLVREALERVFAPRGVVRVADSPLRTLEGLPLERGRLVGRRAGARRGRARGLPGRGRPAARAEDRALPRPAAEPARRRVARRRQAGARPLLLPGRVGDARRARGCGLGAGGGFLGAGARRRRAQPRAQRPRGPRGPEARGRLRRAAPARAGGGALRARDPRPARAGQVAQAPGGRRPRLPRAEPRGDGAARGGGRAHELLVQPPPRRRALPPGAARVGPRRAPAVPRRGVARRVARPPAAARRARRRTT